MHDRFYTPARAHPQSLEHFRIFIQQELDKIAQAFMMASIHASGGCTCPPWHFDDGGPSEVYGVGTVVLDDGGP